LNLSITSSAISTAALIKEEETDVCSNFFKTLPVFLADTPAKPL